MLPPALLLPALLAAAAAGGAAPDGDACGRGDYTECYRSDPRFYLDAFGLPSAETRLAAGDQVRRAMYFGRSVNPMVAVEYRRAAGQEPMVSLYLRRHPNVALPEPAVSVPIPLEDWERIGDWARFFDRSLAPLPREPRGESIMVCADGGFDIVEVTEPGESRPRARLRQRAEQGCDDGLATLYADQMAEAAVRLVPACRGLDQDGGPVYVLRACAMLQGDRAAAAIAHNRLRRLRFADAAADIADLFSTDAVLDWTGTRTTGGSRAAAAWIVATRGDDRSNLHLLRLVGETSERVRADGVLERWTRGGEGPSLLWHAPVQLALQWMPDRQFRVVEARVGAFARAPARCDPARLSGAGGC